MKTLEDRLKILEGMGKIKSTDKLSDRLHRLEVKRKVNPVKDDDVDIQKKVGFVVTLVNVVLMPTIIIIINHPSTKS